MLMDDDETQENDPIDMTNPPVSSDTVDCFGFSLSSCRVFCTARKLFVSSKIPELELSINHYLLFASIASTASIAVCAGRVNLAINSMVDAFASFVLTTPVCLLPVDCYRLASA